ncbi:hypothetical protein SARC_00998 [Sphaeroforma arctica JP610]|uniref:Uncharacterized protein n=1 Tax=Sphaeroforma arctica JP610 TaxID=667725 RepID=A0A0L0GCV8_9EUKA|nr:hypothetical protein SARC_00998 [Sphaeroforma arctica JP610]KNC86852.1 hypothetical protein SARC_00998 [Sphaeroforma arctica JP610]|eukprot:XP_014160754.1 hypothetical protein SARC_00998 [Sphaeroforma arctica JP610]
MLRLNYPINNLDSTDTLYRRMRYEDFVTGHRLMCEHTVVEIVRSRVDGPGTPNTDTIMLAANSTNWDDFLAPNHTRSDGNDDDGIGTTTRSASQFGENKDATCVFDALITTAQLVSNLILSHNGVRAKKCGDVLLNILVPLIQREKEKHLSLRKTKGLNELLTNLADRANISINLATINLKRLMHIKPTRAAVSWTSQDIRIRELLSKHVPTRHRVFTIMFIDVNQVTHMKMSLRAYRDHVMYTTHLEVTKEDIELLMRKHTEDPWSNQINAIKYHRGGQLAAIHFKNIWLTTELINIRLVKIKEQCLEVRLGGHVAQFVKLACADFLS